MSSEEAEPVRLMRALMLCLAATVLVLACAKSKPNDPEPPEYLEPKTVLEWNPTADPTGSEVAYFSVGARPHEIPGVWALDLGTGTRRYIGAGFYPSWSPDGSTIACSQNGRIVAYHANGDGEHMTVAQESGFFYPTWSPDGKRILCERTAPWQPRGLWMLDVESGAAPYRAIPDTEAREPAWSPDGRWIAYLRIVSPSLRHLCVISPDGQRQRELLSAGNCFSGRPLWSKGGDRIVVGTDHGMQIVDPESGEAKCLSASFEDSLGMSQTGCFVSGDEWIVYTKTTMWMIRCDGTGDHPIPFPK